MSAWLQRQLRRRPWLAEAAIPFVASVYLLVLSAHTVLHHDWLSAAFIVPLTAAAVMLGYLLIKIRIMLDRKDPDAQP